MAHQVFISYSTRDEATARDVVASLEADSLPCWIASRDIRPGLNYQESIVRAIRGAQVLVLLFSENANASREVLKELSVAGSFGVPVLPLRLAPVKPSEGLLYELSTCQWIDGWPDRRALARLATAILERLGTMIATGPPQLRVAPPARSSVTSPPPASPPAVPARSTPMVADATATFRRLPPLDVSRSGLEALQELLTWHVGPIARILIRRAKTEALTTEDLCERLAAQLPGIAERDEFLLKARECVRL